MWRLKILVVLLVVSSCQDVKHPDMDQAMEEMENREILRFSDSEVESHAGKLGKEIFNSTQINNPDSLNSVLKKEKLGGLVLVKSKEETRFDYEKQVWEAYEYSVKNGLPTETNLQEINDGDFLINEPIIRNSVLTGMWSLQLNRGYVVRDISKAQ